MLGAELPLVPRPTIEKYVKGLLQPSFDTKGAVQLASVQDVIHARMARGHALHCEDVWRSTRSSNSSCSSDSGCEHSSSRQLSKSAKGLLLSGALPFLHSSM